MAPIHAAASFEELCVQILKRHRKANELFCTQNAQLQVPSVVGVQRVCGLDGKRQSLHLTGQWSMIENAFRGGLEYRGLTRINVCVCDRDTTTETLRQVFSQFGELEDAIVTVDRHSGKSKGYGFVTFRYAVNAAAAVVEQEKQIDVSAFKLVLSAHHELK